MFKKQTANFGNKKIPAASVALVRFLTLFPKKECCSIRSELEAKWAFSVPINKPSAEENSIFLLWIKRWKIYFQIITKLSSSNCVNVELRIYVNFKQLQWLYKILSIITFEFKRRFTIFSCLFPLKLKFDFSMLYAK